MTTKDASMNLHRREEKSSVGFQESLRYTDVKKTRIDPRLLAMKLEAIPDSVRYRGLVSTA